MRQDSLISIIVPLYNVETYLPWCLDSIMAQSYQNFELFLVDDGSTDDSGAICDEYASKDERINVIHQKNSGPSIARNTALDLIKGEYLTFIDSDDVVHHRYLEVLLENMQNYGADISAVTFSRVSEYGKLGEADFSGKVATYNPIKAIKRILYQKDLENSAWGKLYKSHLFDNVRFPESIYYEDLAIFYKVYEKAKKIVFEQVGLYGYRKRPSSIMGNFSLKRADVLDVTDDFVKHIELNNPNLLSAAKDRKFSANMNILWLMTITGIKDEEIVNRCWGNIKELRCSSLFNPQVRLKNKIGALASFLGLKVLCFLFGMFKE